MPVEMNWHCPELFPDSTMCIVGGGPSVERADFRLLGDRPCIGVNSAFRLGDFVDICVFGDARWYNLEYGALRGFKGMVVGLYPFKDKGEIGQTDGVDVKLMNRSRTSKGIDDNRKNLCWNGSSGGAAVNLAVHLGAKRIILVGFDMRKTDGRHNFHDIYPWNAHRPDRNPYRIHIKAWPVIAAKAKFKGIKIVNTFRGSAIKEFEFMKLEEAVERWQ